MINIIYDFLTDRTMRVKVGGTLSSERQVFSGVPQGSVLGPLLFLLFINDIPEDIKNVLKIFADDVKMVADPLEYEIVLNDLEKLNSWEDLWGLKFNLEKCKVIHIGKKNPCHDYSFEGSVLSVVDEEKDLGVVFNSTYSFRSQIYDQ